jgi:hypothetical protein
MSIINLTGTTNMGSILLNEKSSIDIEFVSTDENNAPVNFPTGTWRMNIFVKGETASKMMLTQGNGLETIANVFKKKRTAAQNTLTNGNYFFEIRCDFVDGTNIIPFIGTIKIENINTGV